MAGSGHELVRSQAAGTTTLDAWPAAAVPLAVELLDAGLVGAGDWVQADPRTLDTSFDGEYAIGDVTSIPKANGQPLPQAGVLAAAQGEVVAQRIAARLVGRAADVDLRRPRLLLPGDRRGAGELVRGNLLASPAPEVELTEPSADFLAQKARYERERLDAWFPAGVTN